jgi:hypothetical protein
MYRKKAKKIEKIRVSTSSNFDKDSDYRTLKKLYTRIKKKYRVAATDIISKLEKKEILIPSCIFNKKLSIFESIVKYLKENLGLANKEIAVLTFKSQKSIWQSYNSAKKKLPSIFKITVSDHYIPISILQKPFTILESVVLFLKDDLLLSFHKIAVILKRDDRTIWTVYNRAKKKQ